jgi:hypothetical protein
MKLGGSNISSLKSSTGGADLADTPMQLAMQQQHHQHAWSMVDSSMFHVSSFCLLRVEEK